MAISTAFYNAIAGSYNSQMTESDNNVRKHVIKIFTNNIFRGNILDFGGGTGLDLPWLLSDMYKVYFLEPSSNMRLIAKKSVSENPRKPIFAEEMTDFQNWSGDHLPFNEKMNGILANFAVLNCIPDIECLFEKLSLIGDHNCYIQATVLDTRPLKIMRSHSLKVGIKLLFDKQLITLSNYKGVTQETYLHSIKKYKSAAIRYFNFISFTSIQSSHFALLILSKK